MFAKRDDDEARKSERNAGRESGGDAQAGQLRYVMPEVVWAVGTRT